MFYITGKKGFHIKFENDWTCSVQFGPGNYCDNYDRSIRSDNEISGEKGSTTAECAAWADDGDLVSLPDFMGEDVDTVSNRSTPAQVLQLLNWVSNK